MKVTQHRAPSSFGARVLLTLAPALALLAFTGSATAAGGKHVFKETFGFAAHPTFITPESLAVDQSTGDLLVVDRGAATLSRFKPDGEPAAFSALGTNVIDAKAGSGGKPCAEEPASCDQTPENGFTFGVASEVQVAVDDSGGLTDGDIYVTQSSRNLIDIFAADGRYLGQLAAAFNEEQTVELKQAASGFYKLTFPPGVCGHEPVRFVVEATATQMQPAVNQACGSGNVTVTQVLPGTTASRKRTFKFGGTLSHLNIPQLTGDVSEVVPPSGQTPSIVITTVKDGRPGVEGFESPCGVTVDLAGHVYASSFSNSIFKFVPSANPPTASDQVAKFPSHASGNLCGVAAATPPVLFANSLANIVTGGSVYKVSGTTGAFEYSVAPAESPSAGNVALTVDPASGRPLATIGKVATEYDASGATEAVKESTLTATSAIEGIAVSEETGDVYISRSGASNIEVFGPVVFPPIAEVFAPTGVTATEATLRGSVNPQGTSMQACHFEYLSAAAYEANGNSFSGSNAPAIAQCVQSLPPGTKAQPVSAVINGLEAETTYHVRLFAENEVGPTTSGLTSFATSLVAVTNPATEVGATTASLNGEVNPVGVGFSSCKFEYLTQAEFAANGGSYSGPDTPRTQACNPSAGMIEPDFAPHLVKSALVGLTETTTYHFRVVAAKGSTVFKGEDLTFTTVGAPIVTELLSLRVTQTSAELQASVNPQGSPTTYHFEYDSVPYADGGPAHGARIPANFEGSVGEGNAPAIVSAQLDGLSEASEYYFRVVATNARGVTTSPEQVVETLDSCGMLDRRCFELVSRPDKGPVANPGKQQSAGRVIQFQAAPEGSGLAYTVEFGYPDAGSGDEAAYLARRGSAGWNSTEASPPARETTLLKGSSGYAGRIETLSSNLNCAVVASSSLLTSNAPSTVREAGGANLYRLDTASGTFQVITNLPPVNVSAPKESEQGTSPPLAASEYLIVGMSPDCKRIIFRSQYRYPGLPSVIGAKSQLYEWDHGSLRNAALIPGPGGASEPVVGAEVGGSNWRAVSEDGTRSIFTAVSEFGGDKGKQAVFLRDASDPMAVAESRPATDISQSETATANRGNARYWGASADGKHVFFTAQYGLATNGSSAGATSCSGAGEGCDLYEYDAEAAAGHRLIDLSPDTADAKGAGTAGVLTISEDGTHVYFAAQGRLGGAGRTEVENREAGTYNLYLAHAGHLEFVHLLGQAEVVGQEQQALISSKNRTSEATPAGSALVFESALGIPGGVSMVYWYSSASHATTCVSCRHDGLAPYSAQKLTPLIGPTVIYSEAPNIQPVTITEGGRVYFYSFDPLATGAVEGQRNLYQWEHGQVSLITTEPEGVPRGLGTPNFNFFAGASADGGDVYFTTPRALIGADQDERWDVYDARAGGGFPEETPATPCEPLVESSCQQGSGAAPAQAVPTTPSFNGPGNQTAQQPTSKKQKKKKKSKKSKKQRNKARRAVDHRGAGK